MTKTDYRDPSTIDVDTVIGNIYHEYRMRAHRWDSHATWPNVTVKALADEILRLRVANDRLERAAYVRIPIPRWFRRRS